MLAYTVQPGSLAMRRSMARLPLPPEVSVVSVIRDGTIRGAADLEHLAPGDDVLLLSPQEHVALLDRVFGTGKPAKDLSGRRYRIVVEPSQPGSRVGVLADRLQAAA